MAGGMTMVDGENQVQNRRWGPYRGPAYWLFAIGMFCVSVLFVLVLVLFAIGNDSLFRVIAIGSLMVTVIIASLAAYLSVKASKDARHVAEKVNNLHAAWNDQDCTRVLDAFADNADIYLMFPKKHESHRGRQQIEGFIKDNIDKYSPVTSTDYRTDENEVTWESRFHRESGEPVEGTVVAIFEKGNIAYLSFTPHGTTSQ
jgi:hypothetical protein